MTEGKTATVYRMVLPDHICPYGERAKALLEEYGFAVDDRLLQSREEVDAFMDEHGLSTTPLVVIDGTPVGGSDDLERYLAQSAAGPDRALRSGLQPRQSFDGHRDGQQLFPVKPN